MILLHDFLNTTLWDGECGYLAANHDTMAVLLNSLT